MKKCAPLMLLMIALSFSTGCKVFQPPTEPYARFTKQNLKDVDDKSALIEYSIRVYNPLEQAVKLNSLEATLEADQYIFHRQRLNHPSRIGPRSSITVNFTVDANLYNLKDNTRVRTGDRVTYYTTVVGNTTMPNGATYNFSRRRFNRLPLIDRPIVSIRKIQWLELTQNRARGTLYLDVTNTNNFEYDINSLNYNLAIEGVEVAGSGVSSARRLKPNETVTYTQNLTIVPKSYGNRYLYALQRARGRYAIYGNIWGDTPFTDPIKSEFKAQGTTIFQR